MFIWDFEVYFKLTIICKCGCKKTDHYNSADWGINKGDCKNCFDCDSFTVKYCAVKNCENERESYFIFCKIHQKQDNKKEIVLN